MPVFSVKYIMNRLLRSGGNTFYLVMIFIVGFLLLPGFNNPGWGQPGKYFFAAGFFIVPDFFLYAFVKMKSARIGLSYRTIFHLKTQGL